MSIAIHDPPPDNAAPMLLHEGLQTDSHGFRSAGYYALRYEAINLR